MSGLPMQSQCDPNDPEEFALWAFMAEAGPTSQSALIFPPYINRQRSKELWEKGFRHHPELQEKFYIPPHDDANFIEGAAGRWVSKDEVLTPKDTAPRINNLTVPEMLALRKQLDKALNSDDQAHPASEAFAHTETDQ